MAELDKVIKAIEVHISTDDSVGCDDCTYENDGWCMTRVFADALELLKEQAGTGCWEWIKEDKYRCSECNSTTYVDECMEEPQYLFCPYCGKKMTWAGRNF